MYGATGGINLKLNFDKFTGLILNYFKFLLNITQTHFNCFFDIIVFGKNSVNVFEIITLMCVNVVYIFTLT